MPKPGLCTPEQPRRQPQSSAPLPRTGEGLGVRVTLRWLMGEEQITHLGAEYYQDE